MLSRAVSARGAISTPPPAPHGTVLPSRSSREHRADKLPLGPRPSLCARLILARGISAGSPDLHERVARVSMGGRNSQ